MNGKELHKMARAIEPETYKLRRGIGALIEIIAVWAILAVLAVVGFGIIGAILKP